MKNKDTEIIEFKDSKDSKKETLNEFSDNSKTIL